MCTEAPGIRADLRRLNSGRQGFRSSLISPSVETYYALHAIMIKSDALREIKDYPGLTREALTAIKIGIKKRGDMQPTSAVISAHYVNSRVTAIADKLAWNAEAAKDEEVSVYWRDLAIGASQITGTVFIAQLTMSPTGRKFLDKTTKWAVNMKKDMPPAKDMKTNAALVDSINEWHDLLQQDPSGFTLLERHLSSIRNMFGVTSQEDPAIHIPSFFLAGTDLAYKVYAAVYPLAAALPEAATQSST